MSLRARIVASIAVAASAFLLAPAAAHPVQVSGAKLKSALLLKLVSRVKALR